MYQLWTRLFVEYLMCLSNEYLIVDEIVPSCSLLFLCQFYCKANCKFLIRFCKAATRFSAYKFIITIACQNIKFLFAYVNLLKFPLRE